MKFYKRDSKLNNLIIQSLAMHKDVLKLHKIVRSGWLWLTTSIANSFFLFFSLFNFIRFNGTLFLITMVFFCYTGEKSNCHHPSCEVGRVKKMRHVWWRLRADLKVCFGRLADDSNLPPPPPSPKIKYVTCWLSAYLEILWHLNCIRRNSKALCLSLSSLCSKEISI